jgi:predicted GNAT family acetyltransferase
MKVRTHQDTASFLEHTQAELESNEASNSLMLGICAQLKRHTQRLGTRPCLKTVEDEGGLVFAAIMTPPHKLVVYGHRGDLQRAARLLADNLADEGWHLPGVLGPAKRARLLADAWARITGTSPELERQQRVFELRRVVTPTPERGRLRQATQADSGLVARWWHAFYVDVFGRADREQARLSAEARIGDGDVYLWVDLWPVSMAMKTRPTRNGISVSMVYTPPELRAKGYATACTGELSRLLLDSGRSICTLFADASNAAANRVYERIGYRPVCDVDEILFRDDQ